MGTQLRLLSKQFRFELVASGIAVVAVFIATILIHAHITAILPTKACIDGWNGSEADALALGCHNMTEYFSRVEHEAGQLTGAFILLPPLLGIVLGTILVSREIEQRTAQFAWSLGSNRLRWLGERVLPVAAYFLVLLVLLAVAADLLVSARVPYIDTRAAFIDYGQRGIPLIGRGMAGFALALLIGSVVGRQLPALILATLVPIGLLYAGGALFPYGVPFETIVQEATPTGFGSLYYTDYISSQVFIDKDGKVSDMPAPGTADADIKTAFIEIPGRRLVEVETREGAMLAGVAAVGFGATAVMVRRRRPY